MHFLCNTHSGTLFASGDIDEGKIFYVLDEGSNATDDSFFFKVIDKGQFVTLF